jgi:hypothetical protein
MDLVYADEGEGLDPREREAATAHLAGCARCSGMLERLRSGVRAAEQLPLEDPSSLLEARILAAASAVKPKPSWSRRVTRAMSTVGGWAMRPQIAMAAVLVIMVGTSVLLLRGGLPTAHRTKVTDEGQPVATLEPPALSEGQAQNQGAPAVIGGEKKPVDLPRAEADKQQVAEAPATPPAEANEATKNKDEAADDGDGKDLGGKLAAKGGPMQSGAGGMPAPTATAPAAAAPAPAPPPPAAEPPADLAKSDTKAEKESPAKKTASADAVATPASFDDSMTAYKEGRYAASAKGFEAQANANVKPSTSWLYAARSFRASGSCVQAIPRFQKVLTGYPASAEVPWAALEGGQCARSIGDPTTARTLLEKAKTYPATQKQAEAELASMNAPPPAPAKAKAKPPSMMDNGY